MSIHSSHKRIQPRLLLYCGLLLASFVSTRSIDKSFSVSLQKLSQKQAKRPPTNHIKETINHKGSFRRPVETIQESELEEVEATASSRRLAATFRGGALIDEPSASEDIPLPPPPAATLSFSKVLHQAFIKGLGGGIPGAIAGVVQVLTLMWLRTLINYQCRYGTTFSHSLQILYQQGGIRRFYQGLEWAIIQAPLVRFVSTFANDGVNLLWNAYFAESIGSSTAVAAIVVGAIRILLMPLDTVKTVLQVDAQEGFAKLKTRLSNGDIGVLYQGAAATAISSMVAHYPWFFTFTFLSHSEALKAALPDSKLIQNALFGFLASLVSDVTVNAFRVIKTTKQTMGSSRSKGSLTYAETIHTIVKVDGIQGLLGRGLKARILSNGIQSVVFAVIWKGLSEELGKLSSSSDSSSSSSADMLDLQAPAKAPLLTKAPDFKTTIFKGDFENKSR